MEEEEMEAKIKDSEVTDAIDQKREEERIQAEIAAYEFKKLSKVMQRNDGHDSLPRPTSFNS
jgi:hypothetical protein